MKILETLKQIHDSIITFLVSIVKAITKVFIGIIESESKLIKVVVSTIAVYDICTAKLGFIAGMSGIFYNTANAIKKLDFTPMHILSLVIIFYFVNQMLLIITESKK